MCTYEACTTGHELLASVAQFCDDVAVHGWHEYNGGNISVHVSAFMAFRLIEAYADLSCYTGEGTAPESPIHDIKDARDTGAAKRLDNAYRELSKAVPEMAGEYFIVSASGCLMKNVSSHMNRDTGLVQVDETGAGYRIVAGFNQGKRPTSEFVCHLMVHAACADTTAVVYHAHTPWLVSLSHVVQPLTACHLTAELWSTFTECPLFCPKGIGVVDFKVPGSVALAQASAAIASRYQAILWAKHGILAYGATLDDVYGVVETIEKAARIALNVRSATTADSTNAPAYASVRQTSMLTKDDIRMMDESLSLGLNTDILESIWE